METKKYDVEELRKQIASVLKEYHFNDNADGGLGERQEYVEETAYGCDIHQQMLELYENEEIDDEEWEEFEQTMLDIIADEMSKLGYESYCDEHTACWYYSTLPKAQKGYDELLNELDSMGLRYEISRSWNPGELPSIYVTIFEDEEDEENTILFRIANHYNSQNEEWDERLNHNVIYENKDYINYRETILEDLKKELSFYKD